MEPRQLEIYWMREAWSGAWHDPVCLGGAWPENVPPEVRMAVEERLEDYSRAFPALPPKRQVEVHLPYEIFRQARPDAYDVLAEPGGRILVRGQTLQPWAETLTLYHTRLIAMAALRAERKSMMRLRARTPSGCYLELPARAFVLWKALPLPGRTAHSDLFRHVSVAVQRAFRRYFDEAFFDSIERFEHTELAWAVLAFACSRPFRMRNSGEFTWDVMSFEVTRKALRFTRNALTARLSEVEDLLYAAGRNDLARLFAPFRTRSIMIDIIKEDRYFTSFLRVESKLVDTLVKFAYEMRNLRERQRELRTKRARDRAAHDAIRIASEAGRKLNSLLRRLAPHRDFPELGSIILLEATYALNGRKTPLPERSPLADTETLETLSDSPPAKSSLGSAYARCEAELRSFLAEEANLLDDELAEPRPESAVEPSSAGGNADDSILPGPPPPPPVENQYRPTPS